MKIINLFYLCALVLTLNLGAMQQLSQHTKKNQAEPFIKIVNHTDDSLQAAFKYRDTEEQVLCIEPFNELKLPAIRKLESLYVVKYGKWVKFTNRSYFTFGFVGPYNIMQDETINEFLKLEHSVQVNVTSSGKNVISALTSASGPLKIAAFISPYSYAFQAAQETLLEEQNDDFFLFDHFPRVKRAFRAEQEIYERYFLDLPAGADKHAELKAYERMRDLWAHLKEKSKDPARIKLAEDALKFVSAAWTSLSMGGQFRSQFISMVDAETAFPTSYFFEQEPWTEEMIASWIEMGGTYEPQNKVNGPGAAGSQQNNNNE